MTSANEICVKRKQNIAWISITRPERMNALSPSTFARLIEVSNELDEDPDVRVLIYTGTGDRAFSAGVDLKSLDAEKTMSPPMKGLHRNLNEVIMELSKPTIAAINGVAAGGGLELALACDIRTASSNARMGLPEAKVGLGANFGSVVLPQLIGRSKALELLYTGDLISAQEAWHLGLINHVYPDADLIAETQKLADKIADNAPLSIQRMKATVLKSAGLPTPAGLRLEVGPNVYASADRQEGARAFVEKRKPVFTGK